MCPCFNEFIYFLLIKSSPLVTMIWEVIMGSLTAPIPPLISHTPIISENSISVTGYTWIYIVAYHHCMGSYKLWWIGDMWRAYV